MQHILDTVMAVEPEGIPASVLYVQTALVTLCYCTVNQIIVWEKIKWKDIQFIMYTFCARLL